MGRFILGLSFGRLSGLLVLDLPGCLDFKDFTDLVVLDCPLDP